MALPSIRVLRRRFTQFCRLPGSDKVLLGNAVVTIARCQLAVRRSRLDLTGGTLGSPEESPATLSDVDAHVAQRVALAIRGATSAIPWTTNCLPQSLAAHRLLRDNHVSSTIYFAATPRLDATTAERIHEEVGEFAAHAWVRSGEIFVAGGDIKDAYTPIVWFGQST